MHPDEELFFSIKSRWSLVIWNKWALISKNYIAAIDQHASVKTCCWLERGSSSMQGCTTRLLRCFKKFKEMKYTHRKQSCNIHFADDSANTSSNDTLRWKHYTGRTIREKKPSCISPESRFQNPLAACGTQCRFSLPCSVESQKVFMRNGRGFLLLPRGWRSFYAIALKSDTGVGRPQRMKKCNPFREPVMSPRIKNTFQWTGQSHAWQDHTGLILYWVRVGLFPLCRLFRVKFQS